MFVLHGVNLFLLLPPLDRFFYQTDVTVDPKVLGALSFDLGRLTNGLTRSLYLPHCYITTEKYAGMYLRCSQGKVTDVN